MHYSSMRRTLAAAACSGLAVMARVALAADAPEPPPFSSGKTLAAQTGQQIYQTSCQGCHMANGKGAHGAGNYPALASNATLAGAEYVLHVVLEGKNGMPGFRSYLSDAQLADVVNHVRSNFGNHYGTALTADFVREFSSTK